MSAEEKSLVDNTADEEQVKKAIQVDNQQQNVMAAAWRDALQVRACQLVLEDILEFCAPLRTPFSVDERHTCLTIGKQDVGRYIIDKADKANPVWLVTRLSRALKDVSTPPTPRRRNARRNRSTRNADARGSGPRADRQPTTE